MQEHSLGSCYVRWNALNVVIGNDRIEREWSLKESIPAATQITNKTSGRVWLAPAKPGSFSLPGLGGPCGQPQVDTYDEFGISENALRVRISLVHSKGVYLWTHLVYTSSSFIRSYFEFVPTEDTGLQAVTSNGEDPGTVATDSPSSQARNTNYQIPAANAGTRPLDLVEATPKNPGHSVPPRETSHTSGVDTLDCFTLAPLHVRWRAVLLRDVTDKHDNLVSVEQGLLYDREIRNLQGNMMVFSESLGESGLIVIKESPTPLAQLNYYGYDFLVKGREVSVIGSGYSEWDLSAGEALQSYGVAVGVCHDGEAGAMLAIQEYHRSIHKPVPTRDFYVMSNNWGDRSRDQRVNEAFILAELPVAAQLGISIYQIDDGWQTGATTASNPTGKWEGFYNNELPFWLPHTERFPRGLSSISTRAKELGVRLGLWFAPDSDNHFANWEKDAAILISLYKDYGITHFKLDAVKIRSKVGEERFVRMLRRVVDRSNRQVTFNLDTTAEVRLGYYGRNLGNLFLENRYTDWHNYFPHRTLRNLWMLSEYFPTNRLQIEFLNVARNADKYGDDPLAPTPVGTSYAFGVTACANPLAWMELTGLSQTDQDTLARLITAYRKHQEEILGGWILPIGQEPDGTGWSGFQCLVNERSGYLAIYRERSKYTRHRYQLWQLANCRLELTPVIGTGQERRLEVDARGETWITLPHPMSYALYRYAKH